MTPSVFDHMLVALLVIVVPIGGAWLYRRFLETVRAGQADARAREYRRTIAQLWGLTAIAAVIWLGHGRPVVPVWPGLVPSAAGFAIAVAGLASMWAQRRAILKLPAARRAAVVEQFASVRDLLPFTAAEGRLFNAVAVTAGITEELLYRGYLLWYLTPVAGVWPAVVIGALVFGLGHAYQGLGGIAKTSVVGVLTGVLYVLTGSLIWPMILHAGIDVHSGAIVRELDARPGESGA